MKSRKWILFVALLVILPFLLTAGMRIFGTPQVIESMILKRLRPLLGEGVSIESVNFTLGSIIFNGFSYESDSSPARVSIGKIRFNVKPLNIFFYGPSPYYLFDEIYIDDWSVSFTQSDNQAESAAELKADSTDYHFAATSLWDVLKKPYAIKRINIAGGSLDYHPFKIENIFCWIDFIHRDSVYVDLSAETFSDTANLRIQGSVKPIKETAQFNLNLGNTDIAPGFQPVSDVTIDKMRIYSSMHGEYSGDSLTLNGNFTFNQADMLLDGRFRVSESRLRMDMTENDAILEGGGELFGQPVVVNGFVEDCFDPWGNLVVHAKGFNITPLLSEVLPDLKAEGLVDMDITIEGEPLNPNVSFTVYSDELGVYKSDYKNAEFKGNYFAGEVNLDHYELDGHGGKFSGSGSINLGKAESSLNISANYSGKPEAEEYYPGLSDAPIDSLDLALQVSGKFDNPQVIGRFSLLPTIEVNRLNGDIIYSTSHLELFQSSGSGDSLGLVIDWAGREPIFTLSASDLQQTIPELLPQFARDRINKSKIRAEGNFKRFNFNLDASGDAYNLNFRGNIDRGAVDKFLGNYKILVHDSLSTQGDLVFRVIGDSLFLDNFTIGPEFYAWGSMDLKNMNIGEFRAKADYFPLNEALLYYGFDNYDKIAGDLKIDIQAEGELKSPQVELNCYLSQGSFFNQTGYWGTLAGELDKSDFRLIRLDFGNSGQTLFRSRGSYNFATRELDFRNQLDNVDYDLLLNAIIGKKGLLTGTGRYGIKVNGTTDSIRVESHLWVEDGTLVKIPFDQLTGNFEIFRNPDSHYTLNVPTLRLFRNDGYDVDVSGNIPFGDEDLGISLLAKGNLLSMLPHLERTIKAGYGNGTAELTIGGRLDSLEIQSARIDYNNGILELRSVADRITDLKLNAELEDDFIHIKSLTGKIKGNPFVIKTIPDGSNYDVRLEPWVIGALGLKLGIITIETGSSGLELNIPSFIAPNETAVMIARGRTEGETALIAGPEENPRVRAELVVQNGEVIYPNPSGGGPRKHPNAFQKLLRRINWDLEIIPDKGNRYRREITGIKGNPLLENISRVDVDMNIDRQVEGLKINGVIEDTSLSIDGNIASTRGTMNFLDLDFQVQEFLVEFDPTETLPWVEGYATTTERDTLDRPITIDLRVAHVNPETGEKTYRARWGDFTFILEDEMGNSQEQILTYLGFAPGGALSDRMAGAGFQAVNNAVFGSWLGTIEREVRSILGVDYVDINPAVAQNLLADNLFYQDTPGDTLSSDWRARYFRKSRFTIGKYLTDDMFLTYSGRFESGETTYDTRERLGLIHTWNLEYRLPTRGSNLLMVLGYEYDSLEKIDDRRISISYRFNY